MNELVLPLFSSATKRKHDLLFGGEGWGGRVSRVKVLFPQNMQPTSTRIQISTHVGSKNDDIPALVSSKYVQPHKMKEIQLN